MKKAYIIPIAIILVLSIVIIFLYKCFASYTISVKTEFGDQFSVLCDDFGHLYVINDVNSDFYTGLYYFSNENQIHSVCDNQYIRCYRISDSREDGYKDKFIFKIKKYDEFFSVRYGDVKYSDEYMFKDDAEKVKSEFLCDDLLMKICIIDLDYLYHDEMLEVGNKLINHQFDELEKYGLTKDMISDTDSLEEKVTVMENYLKEF